MIIAGTGIVRPAEVCCLSLHEHRLNSRQHSQYAIGDAGAN